MDNNLLNFLILENNFDLFPIISHLHIKGYIWREFGTGHFLVKSCIDATQEIPKPFEPKIPRISQVCRSRASHQSPCLALPAATPSLWTGWPELKMMDPGLRYTHCYDPCNYVRFIERRSGNFLEVLHRC